MTEQDRPAEGPALGDAHLRRPLDGRRRPTRSTAATSPRARPACRSPSTCRPRPATTPTRRSPAARSARSASRSRTSARCARLFDDIPLTEMNTSMTINATAMWLLAMYQVVAEEQNAGARRPRRSPHQLAGTTQNDIIKEYLSRGTYVFPPEHSLRLIERHDRLHGPPDPEVEPDQHLQLPPAGGRARRRRRSSPTRCAPRSRCSTRSGTPARSPRTDFEKVVGRISFFVNAGVRFVEEMCKMRAFVELWDEITRERYGVAGPEDAPVPVRRAGQLARPDRGAAGEQRAADRARDARRHAVARTPGPAPSSCRPGTRRSACRGRGTSSGRCGCSRCWRSSPTCWSTTTSSTARPSSRPRSPSWSRAPRRRSTGSRRWAARSRRSSPAT